MRDMLKYNSLTVSDGVRQSQTKQVIKSNGKF